MNVLWIAGAHRVGGAEQVGLVIARGLQDRGHKVTALLPVAGPLGAAARARDLPALRVSLGGSLNVFALTAIFRALRYLRPHVAIVTTSDEWVWSCLVPRPARTRLVLARHMAIPLPDRVERLAARRADRFVTVSEAACRALTRSGRIAKRNVEIIPNPVRWPIRTSVPTDAERRAARITLGLPPDRAWIGFLGGGEEAKGFSGLLDAVAQIRRSLPEVRLLVCGRGDGAAIDASVRARGLAGAVTYLGEVDNVDEVLTAVDVVALATPSRLGEASPLAAIEAMAHGTAVVAPALDGIAEVVASAAGGSGWLTRPDDAGALGVALLEALRSADGRRARAERGLARARDFDPALAVSRYERLFTAIGAGS